MLELIYEAAKTPTKVCLLSFCIIIIAIILNIQTHLNNHIARSHTHTVNIMATFFGRSALSVPQVTTANDLLTSDTIPRVSVFVGATKGIGLATLTSFVSRGQAITAYVIGRDAASQEPLLEPLRAANSQAKLVFIQGEVSLLRDVKRICDEIAAKEDTVDALVLSAGFLPFSGREESEEGLELCMAVGYYSKIAFIQSLLPQLLKSEHPRVVAILSAGLESADVQLDDLDFEKPGRYGPMKIVGPVTAYLTLTLDHIARTNPKLTILHVHPGSVYTGVLTREKGLGAVVNRHVLNWLIIPLVKSIAYTPEESGERSLYVLLNSVYGGWGTPALEGQERAINIDGGVERGAVFLVDMHLKSARQEKVIAALREIKADQAIWDHTANILEKHLHV